MKRFELMRKYAGFLLLILGILNVYAQNSELHLTINSGKSLTNKSTVKLHIAAPHATKMMLSNNGAFTNGTWEAYSTIKNWNLAAGDGDKEIFAKFKDNAGNLSDIVSAKIHLDKTPPRGGKITINKGHDITKKNLVHLDIEVNDADKMMVSNQVNFAGATWKPVETSISGWALAGADGLKKIYVRFNDKAGNVSPTVSSQITYDKTPPRGTAKIKGAPKWINSHQITLDLNCADAEKMKISAVSKEWIPYSKFKEVTLSEGDGVKTVYVKFMDKAHNIGSVIKLTVNLKTTAPVDCKIQIDQGHKFTTKKDKRVSLRTHATGAKYMMLSNYANFTGAKWITYNAIVPTWLLVGEDGEKTVYAKFKDQAENESEVTTGKIMLDRHGPSGGSIIINDGAKLTNKPELTLKLKAIEAEAMEISTVITFGGASWVKYAEEKKMTVTGGDGTKTYYARFKDKAGNVSGVTKTSIVVDRTPPMGSTVSINHKAEWAKTPNVNVAFSSHGAVEMLVSSKADFSDAKWEPYKTTKTLTLSGPDGFKSVGAKFKDGAGNISKVAFDKIKLSTAPPSELKIVINGDKEFATKKDRHAKILLHAKGATKMKVSNSKDFIKAGWIPYSTTKDLWLLTAGDGKKTVYAKFLSPAGVESEVISDDIIQDLTPPTKCSITIDKGAKGTNDKEGKVNLAFTTQGGVEIMVTDNGSFSGKSWEPFVASKTWNLKGTDGLKKLSVKFKDKSGNITRSLSSTIKLDRNPPSGSFTINHGKKFTTALNVKLYIKAVDAYQMQISNASSFGSEWRTVSPEVNWKLIEGDGLKTVNIRFRDHANNISEITSAVIEVDTKAPDAGSLVINDNAEYCTDHAGKVTLEIKTSDDVTKMKVSNRIDFKGSHWIDYTATREWHLIPGSAERKVNVKFMDEAGNESEAVSDIINVDFTPPAAGKITIDNGRKYSKSTDWSANLAIETTGADEMMISNDAGFADAVWEPYATTKTWKLNEGQGKKIVYIKFRDKAGNMSTSVSDDIESDTVF